jgi:peptidoglycan/xylan/chitin deacetylase (PgdA/CDA1 family)
MSRLRVLVLSATRPSRAWRISERISNEGPDFEICGIVQFSLRRLPRRQQLIAAGNIETPGSCLGSRSKASLWLRKLPTELLHWILWFVHGCPPGANREGKFSVEDLAEGCRRIGRPFLRIDGVDDDQAIEFARQQRADLIIALGDASPSQELLDQPLQGLLRVVSVDASASRTAQLQEGIHLRIEHFAKGAQTPCALGSVTIPSQTYDGPFGVILKSDLIADDLFVEAIKSLSEGDQTRASTEVKKWIETTVFPYLDQFTQPSGHSPTAHGTPFDQRYRSTGRLLLQSLLCFPFVTVRNWYRRLRGRYPVVILAHHLVSDRLHRMGMPTEHFWKETRFLQRHYRIVSLSEAERLLLNGRVDSPVAVLTFDDGYRENFITLRAVAEEMAAPVTLFVATQPVELHREFDHDLAAGISGFFALTWEQIRHWSRRGAEIGSHTRTHFNCGSTDRARLEQEIVGSRAELEVRREKPVRFFAFPFGKPENISPEAVELAASAYSLFDSPLGGENLPRKGTRQQHLFRKNFYPDAWELELEMQSVFDLVQSCKQTLKKLAGTGRAWPQTANQ